MMQGENGIFNTEDTESARKRKDSSEAQSSQRSAEKMCDT